MKSLCLLLLKVNHAPVVIFNVTNMSFNPNNENKILSKMSEFTVTQQMLNTRKHTGSYKNNDFIHSYSFLPFLLQYCQKHLQAVHRYHKLCKAYVPNSSADTLGVVWDPVLFLCDDTLGKLESSMPAENLPCNGISSFVWKKLWWLF